MHLWTAVDAEGALEAIQQRALLENQKIGLPEIAFLLPAHVSLKISFFVPPAQAEAAIGEMAAILRAQPAFDIRVQGIERIPGCLWIRMEENAALQSLHQKMVALGEKYGAPPHPFDLNYHYHATLFLSDDAEKMAWMEALLQHFPLPQVIRADRFIIGGSDTGAMGSYRVYQKIPAGNRG